MPRVDLDLVVDVERTARVAQIEGMFDVPEAKRVAASFHFDAPLEARPWQIGLIVGPSGAGKSSVARHLFGDALVSGYDWHPSRSIVDSFGDLPIRDVTGALSSVGFSSPPAWVKPFRVLSNGEKFRAELARALLDPRPLVVVDEFTSVVDRTVGRIGAHAVAKAVRRTPGKRFVAVTCHEDVTEWLQPDWILEPHVGRFDWRGESRRPGVALELVRCHPAAWRWFAPHHYLSADLNPSAKCFAATIDGAPAAFCAVLPFPHPRARNVSRISRLVTLPDFQGVGTGVAVLDQVAALGRARGRRMRITTGHPALVRTLARSPRWNMDRAPRRSSGTSVHSSVRSLLRTTALDRHAASFEFVGAPFSDPAQAARMWEAKAA